MVLLILRVAVAILIILLAVTKRWWLCCELAGVMWSGDGHH